MCASFLYGTQEYNLVYKVGRPAPFAASYMVGREDKRTNNRTMFPTLKKKTMQLQVNYKGQVKIELL